MKERAFRFSLRALLTLAVLTVVSAPLQAQSGKLDLDQIEDHIIRTLERDRVPGAAVAIVREGEVIYLKGFGTDGLGRPIDQDSVFVIGSMSKAFTALVAMRLAEDGRLELDTPVGPNIPELHNAKNTGWQTMTLRHLLTHTSGIPARVPESVPELSLSEHSAALVRTELEHTPGARHVYSSGNYLLAARMLETITGTSFQDLLAEQVLEPLGIASRDESGEAIRLGHRYWVIWPRRVDLPPAVGRLSAATVMASAADMARFLQFQLGDGTWEGIALLSPTGLAAMHDGMAQGDGFTYGLGWRIVDMAGVRTVQHGGVLPDYRGKMILLPDQDMGVVVLTNASSLLPLPITPTSHRLANDIALHIATGPLGVRHLGYRTWLIVFWSGLGLIMIHQTATLIRIALGRDPARYPLWSAVADILMVLAIVFVVPWGIGLSLRGILVQTPDLALWLAVMSAMALCAVFLRFFALIMNRGRQG